MLAKESVLLVFVGWALGQRQHRRAAIPAVVGAVAAGVWWVWLRLLFSGTEANHEIGPPLVGLWDSVHGWVHGRELVGAAATTAALVLGALALVSRGLRHPLGWPILLSLLFTSVLTSDVIGLNYSASRTTMGLALFAALALLTPGAATDSGPGEPGTGGRLDRRRPAHPIVARTNVQPS